MTDTSDIQASTGKPGHSSDEELREDYVFEAAASFAQQRLWFLDQLDPGSSAYNISLAFRLRGTLNTAALEAALRQLVDRHESLRTVFATVDKQPVQVIAETGRIALDRSVADGSSTEQLQPVLERLVGTAFDLQTGPLFRAHLLECGDDTHVLLLVIHHIVADAWSLEILYRELVTLYAAACEQREQPLPELPIQYADFAEWQQEWMTGEELDKQLNYWREQLRDAPELLELPLDHPRPRIQTHVGAIMERQLDAGTAVQLKQLAQNASCTLFHLYLAAFSVLLSRYAAADEFLIGTPIAGRKRPELEAIIGFFVNTLALRMDLTQDPAFNILMTQAKQTTLGAYTHQDLPFEKLVEVLQPERTTSHSPLFQVLFVLTHAVGEGLPLPGLQTESLTLDSGTSKFDLSLFVTEQNEGASLLFEYNTDLFDAATIERMLDHFETLLAGIVANPAAPVSQLPLLPAAERRTLLEDWNRTGYDYAPGATMHGLFERQAKLQPQAIAVRAGGVDYSYAELNRRANKLAAVLRDQGVGPEVLVALCSERCIELITGMLAIQKAGGAYVPVDPDYPPQRVAHMLTDSEAPVLLTQSTLLDRLPEHAAHVICLDTFDWRTDSALDANPDSGVSDSHLGYVIYTSGSTGLPKGVEIEHRNAVALIEWAGQVFSADEWAGVLASTSVCFDLSVFEIFCPLGLGGRLILVKDALALPELEPEAQVTLINTVPSAIAELARIKGIPASVKTVNLAGEPLSTALVNAIYELGTVARVNDLYGPSEDTTYSTWTLRAANALPSIGRPVYNTQAYVLDRHGAPTPIGVPGELYLGGAGVTRGYRKRPELTAQRYVPNPFGSAPGERLYRTGDQVRYRGDGQLEFLGRLDHQIKLRGFRIELGEIETALDDNPGVQQAAVILREDSPGDKRLVAYVVGDADPDTLRAELKQRLPEYMVPSIIVPLAALPLTPNGKLARRALPVPDYADAAEAYVAPRTPVEETLVEIWADVLKLDKVGVHDDFFALGGHSLLATQLVSRVRDALSTEVPLIAVFSSPSVAEFARHIGEPSGTHAATITRCDRSQPLPLSFAQQRLWFLEQLEPGNPAYNFPVAVELTGELDTAALIGALNDLIARHETLRTRFSVLEHETGHAPTQIIDDHADIALRIENTEVLAQGELLPTLTRLSQQPFNITTGPLLRAHLLRTNDHQHVLLLVTHHIVSDGWSLDVMLSEFAAFYRARVTHVPATLANLPVQYADYATWQRNWLAGDELERQLDYWRGQLASAPPVLELPTDRPRPAEQTYTGASVLRWLPDGLQQQLNDLAAQQNCTLYMVLLAAFDVLLASYGSTDEVVVGTPIAGRSRTELEGLIGFLSNTLAVPATVTNNPAFTELLAQVKASTLGAYAHQDLPFEKLVEELQPERAMSHSPIFQIMFVFQNAPSSNLDFAAIDARTIGIEMGIAKFDLLLEMAETPEGLRTGLQYNTDLFDASTIERMLDHFAKLLAGIVADPGQRIQAYPLLDASERRHVLEDFNATAAETVEISVHGLVEQQAERTPDADAVSFGSEVLSYRDLNARANRLARELQRRGAGPGQRVGLCAERGIDTVVGVLAVLKAGSAYVPIDPHYPAERIATMLSDSAAAVLLTQSALADTLPEHGAHTLLLDRFDWEAGDQTNLDAHGETVYAIYTSGSTGTPKGVELTHAGLSNLIQWQLAQPGLNAAARSLQFASLSFDVSFQELFTTWAQGGTLVLVSDEDRRDLAGLAAFVASDGIERVYLPFAALQPLAEAIAAHPARSYRLRDVIVAGEQLQVTPAVRGMFAALGNARLHNQYGPSETHVVTAFTLAGAPADWPALPAIGTPVANTQAYVLDPHGAPVPVGVPGELYLGGVQVAKGYINRPELNAAKFLDDPFNPGQRMYRTGDRVRFLADGTLAYLGRTDDQVKWRGFRIEPGEIETVLAEHPDVRQAAVLLREDTPGDKRLVAYVVGNADDDSLRAHLKQRLPDYMVPSSIVVLDALPLTPSGKLARRALPVPDYADAATAYVAPRTPVEATLAQIWADVLKLDKVGVHDDFFAIGGHSLLATQLVSRVRDKLGAELALKVLFRNPTPESLGHALANLELVAELNAPDDDGEDREEFEL